MIQVNILNPNSPNVITEISNNKIDNESGVFIFPNPTSDFCNIAIKNIVKDRDVLNIEIYNSIGQLVNQIISSNQLENETTIKFDTKPYPSGLYFIKTSYGNQSFNNKVIISH